MILPAPTDELIEKYLLLFNEYERYYPADQAIVKLFKAFPNNKNLEDVIQKFENDLKVCT